MNKKRWLPQLFLKRADGGRDSGVTAYMLIEWKRLFSLGLLHFNTGSREAFHSHAFHAITWWLKGWVTERLSSGIEKDFRPSLRPKVTRKDCCHKIIAHTSTWALTIRGPWDDTWQEIRKGNRVTLTHGREMSKS